MEPLEQQVEQLAGKFRGQAVISVKEATLKKVAEEWRWALAVRLSTGEDFNVQGLATVLKKVWRVNQGVTFVGIPGAIAMVKFDTEEKMTKVLEGGPWTFSGAAVLIKKWEGECQPQEMRFDKLRIWVQVHNLPFELTNEDTAIEVAGVAGEVCQDKRQEGEVLNRKFVRFQVEINIYEPVRAGCYLDREGKSPLWVYFKYERLPPICKECGALCHEKACGGSTGEEGVGEWLRAESEEVWAPGGARNCQTGAGLEEKEDMGRGQSSERVSDEDNTEAAHEIVLMGRVRRGDNKTLVGCLMQDHVGMKYNCQRGVKDWERARGRLRTWQWHV